MLFLQEQHAQGIKAEGGNVVGPPTLSAAAVNAIFARVGSPMVGTGTVIEQEARQSNIDDAFALAVWWAETNDGAAGVGLGDRNPGSVRGSAGYPSAYDGYTIYPSYSIAIVDWFNVLKNRYISRGLTSVYTICYPYVGTSGSLNWANKVYSSMVRYHGEAPPPVLPLPPAASTGPAPTVQVVQPTAKVAPKRTPVATAAASPAPKAASHPVAHRLIIDADLSAQQEAMGPYTQPQGRGLARGIHAKTTVQLPYTNTLQADQSIFTPPMTGHNKLLLGLGLLIASLIIVCGRLLRRRVLRSAVLVPVTVRAQETKEIITGKLHTSRSFAPSVNTISSTSKQDTAPLSRSLLVSIVPTPRIPASAAGQLAPEQHTEPLPRSHRSVSTADRMETEKRAALYKQEQQQEPAQRQITEALPPYRDGITLRPRTLTKVGDAPPQHRSQGGLLYRYGDKGREKRD